jgi:hypothetical protein
MDGGLEHRPKQVVAPGLALEAFDQKADGGVVDRRHGRDGGGDRHPGSGTSWAAARGRGAPPPGSPSG